MFVNSITYENDHLTVEYEKTDANGFFEPKTVFYSYENGLEQIDNTVINDDNCFMLFDEINAVLGDLEEIGVI